MSHNNKAKLKTFYLRQILEDETDAQHGMTMNQILQRLEEYGIKAERKSIYRDIEVLRDFGVDVRTYQRNPVEYAIERRAFDLSELMLLVDAVESCKFLTTRQANTLTANLKTFANNHQRPLLERSIHVEGRIHSKNESVFGNIDILHDALRLRRKVEFIYYKVDVEGNRRPTREGKPHLVTPVGIVYSDGYYYLTAWNDEHESLGEFRIDRIDHLRMTDDKASRNDEISNHSFGDDYEMFGRFGGEPVKATLLVDADKVEIVMDRFGDRAEISRKNATTAKAVVRVRKSAQFFGWIAGLGGTVRIEAPKSLKQEYKDFLLGLIEE